MSAVMGVDPGLNGAIAIMSPGNLSVIDMPTWAQVVGKKQRQRVDAVALAEYMEYAKMIGVELVVIEAVGGRPKQSASAGFVFGYSVGLLYMACVNARLPIETVPPTTWKKLLSIPGKAKGAKKGESEKAIVKRADEILPDYRDQWRGPKGGLMVDRAEAAMLAHFGLTHVLRTVQQPLEAVRTDSEWRLAYRNADTGA